MSNLKLCTSKYETDFRLDIIQSYVFPIILNICLRLKRENYSENQNKINESTQSLRKLEAENEDLKKQVTELRQAM